MNRKQENENWREGEEEGRMMDRAGREVDSSSGERDRKRGSHVFSVLHVLTSCLFQTHKFHVLSFRPDGEQKELIMPHYAMKS